MQELTARLRDLATAGELINATIVAGGDAARLRSVSLDLDRSSEGHRQACAQARSLAFADARTTAEQYAELAGRRLGVAISIQEGNAGYPPPVPMQYFAVAAASAPGAMPTESGDLEVTATVEVRWELVS